MQRVTFGDLRRCKLPPPSEIEPDLIAALRKNIASHHPDSLRLAVPDEMAAMIPAKTAQPPKPEPKPEPPKPA